MREDSWIKPKIPSSDVIESIVAETYGHPLPIEDVGPFVILKKYCDELLNRFREAELDKSPWQRDELGQSESGLLVEGRSASAGFGKGKDWPASLTAGMRYVATGTRFSKDETLAVDSLVGASTV